MEPFDQLIAANRAYVDAGSHHPLPVRPARSLVIVTCMDSRIDAFATLGLQLGEAHVVRVAGARVTDDVLRSLTLSTHVLGTRAVAVIGHTDCGLVDPEGTLVERLTTLMGRPPVEREWGTFVTADDAVREDCARLGAWSDRPDDLAIAGYVLDVTTGALQERVPPWEPGPART